MHKFIMQSRKLWRIYNLTQSGGKERIFWKWVDAFWNKRSAVLLPSLFSCPCYRSLHDFNKALSCFSTSQFQVFGGKEYSPDCPVLPLPAELIVQNIRSGIKQKQKLYFLELEWLKHKRRNAILLRTPWWTLGKTRKAWEHEVCERVHIRLCQVYPVHRVTKPFC